MNAALKEKPISVLMATFGGIGFIPGAPGTYGSIAALPFIWASLSLPLFARFALYACLLVASVVWSDRAGKAFQEDDSQKIVIDEVIGVWIPLIWLDSPTIPWFLFGLVAFRFFDILKPWPVSFFDRHIKGGLGVVLDDFAAGIYAFAVVFATSKLLVLF